MKIAAESSLNWLMRSYFEICRESSRISSFSGSSNKCAMARALLDLPSMSLTKDPNVSDSELWELLELTLLEWRIRNPDGWSDIEMIWLRADAVARDIRARGRHLRLIDCQALAREMIGSPGG